MCCQASAGNVQTVYKTEDLHVHMTSKCKPQIVAVAKILSWECSLICVSEGCVCLCGVLGKSKLSGNLADALLAKKVEMKKGFYYQY